MQSSQFRHKIGKNSYLGGDELTPSEITELIMSIIYYGSYGALLFVPYWIWLYFSNEKKKELAVQTLEKDKPELI